MKRFKEFLEEEKSNTDFIIRDYVIPTISDSILYSMELQQYWNNINWGDIGRQGRDVVSDVARTLTYPAFDIINFNNIPNYPIRPQTPPPSPTVGGGGVGQSTGNPGY